jgi:hypothetical protein
MLWDARAIATWLVIADGCNYYQLQGRYAESEPLYQRSLTIRERVLGPEHPDLAESLNDLAGLYRRIQLVAHYPPEIILRA